MTIPPWPASKTCITHAVIDLAITDVLDHFSIVVDARDALSMTFFYTSDLDQKCDFQVEGAVDEAFAEAQNIGSKMTLDDGSVTKQKDYDTLTDFWPFLRVKVTGQLAPTSGTVNVWIFKETLTR